MRIYTACLVKGVRSDAPIRIVMQRCFDGFAIPFAGALRIHSWLARGSATEYKRD